MMILIDNYDSFTYNLYQYLGEISPDIRVIRNDAVTVSELEAMNPSHLIISPGPGFPKDAGISIEAIRQLGPRIPTLGICLGHQAICEAFGGIIVLARHRVHGKTSQIVHQQTGLLAGLPSPFIAARYHSLVADPKKMPPELLVTAETETGEIMAVQHQRFPITGLQFHPESIASEHGKAILRQFINQPERMSRQEGASHEST
ncbi:aminodeoxychorismate/anthranilate synthase component II [Anoxynatronum sibiricum]|uniref:Aminodeoxychorismate/anthranilate synthase component II n=1 Tax=Anoxynatronum sibiricum TaxID=210623 RepID=A0ABU9VU91_9CLOT